MQLGFASLVGVEPMPFPALVQWTSRNGLDAIEVNVGSNYASIGTATFPGHLDIASIARDGPGDIPALLAEHGVSIASLAPMVNLLTADVALRERRIAEFQSVIDACVALDVHTVVTFTGSAFGMHFTGLPGVGHNHPTNRTRENVAIFREVYTTLADYAGERNIRIAFETAGRGGGEGNLAHSPTLWEAMFDAVPSPALGLSFDPSHLVWLEVPDVPGLIREFGSRIYHFDAKDTEIFPDQLARGGILGDGWWRYRLPGQGALDWRLILSALLDIGYDGVIAIENEDPLCPGTPGVRWAADYLRPLMLPHGTTAPGPVLTDGEKDA